MNRDYPLAPSPNMQERMQKREEKLVRKGNKAVDEGRDRKADRLFGRAARVEDRMIRRTK